MKFLDATNLLVLTLTRSSLRAGGLSSCCFAAVQYTVQYNNRTGRERQLITWTVLKSKHCEIHCISNLDFNVNHTEQGRSIYQTLSSKYMMFMKEVRLLESLGLCQRWKLSMKQDGMHPDQKPREHILHLRMWPDGGITGVVERDTVFGDIFGSWNMKSICFFILNRSKTRSRGDRYNSISNTGISMMKVNDF